MKHLKVKQNYGLELTPIYFNELLFYDVYANHHRPVDFAIKTVPLMFKPRRFYSLMEQEMQHPILVWHNKKNNALELFNGGLRVQVAIEKGYDSIDGIIRSFNMTQPINEEFALLSKLCAYDEKFMKADPEKVYEPDKDKAKQMFFDRITEFSEFSEEFLKLLKTEEYKLFDKIRWLQNDDAQNHFKKEDLNLGEGVAAWLDKL